MVSCPFCRKEFEEREIVAANGLCPACGGRVSVPCPVCGRWKQPQEIRCSCGFDYGEARRGATVLSLLHCFFAVFLLGGAALAAVQTWQGNFAIAGAVAGAAFFLAIVTAALYYILKYVRSIERLLRHSAYSRKNPPE